MVFSGWNRLSTFTKNLYHAIDLVSYDTLLCESSDPRLKALALSTSMPHAGDWLSMIPSPPLDLQFENLDFHHYLQYWLGALMFLSQYNCHFVAVLVTLLVIIR